VSRARFYHGGVRGLNPGDRLLPASRTGNSMIRRMEGEQARSIQADARYSPDFVYVTRSKFDATIFAAGSEGDLYEVEPIGTYGIDPDQPNSFKARAARVRRVLHRHPVPLPARLGDGGGES